MIKQIRHNLFNVSLRGGGRWIVFLLDRARLPAPLFSYLTDMRVATVFASSCAPEGEQVSLPSLVATSQTAMITPKDWA